MSKETGMVHDRLFAEPLGFSQKLAAERRRTIDLATSVADLLEARKVVSEVVHHLVRPKRWLRTGQHDTLGWNVATLDGKTHRWPASKQIIITEDGELGYFAVRSNSDEALVGIVDDDPKSTPYFRPYSPSVIVQRIPLIQDLDKTALGYEAQVQVGLHGLIERYDLASPEE